MTDVRSLPENERPLEVLGRNRDPLDVAEEWVEQALQGEAWEMRDNYDDYPAPRQVWVERGRSKDGNWQRFIDTPLTDIEACCIERLLEIARVRFAPENAPEKVP